MAEHFLRQAKDAREAGNIREFDAARMMVMVALGYSTERA